MDNFKDKLDVVICLGKNPNKDGGLGTLLEERVKLAYKIAKENSAPLILSGGKSHKATDDRTLTEAGAMHKYIMEKYGDDVEIILEETGSSTIQQLCIIKNKHLLPNDWYEVGLVTDKIHLERATNTAQWIFGKNISVKGFGSQVKIPKENIKKYRKREREKLKLSKNNFRKNFNKGDDKALLKYDELYRKTMREHIANGGSPKDILKIPGYH